jgi:manganese efflux pump family protein
MSTLEILAVAVALSMDAFAVSLAAGATAFARSARARFRLSFHFGLFQCLMPIAGWLVGTSVARYIESVDHWVAFGLLGFVGIRMLMAAFREGEEDASPRDPSRGATLVMLSVATSIDALAVGLTLAMLEVGIWYASAIIGVVTGLLSLAAIRLGNRLGERFGRRMEAAGGTILVVIGVRILLQHLGWM